MKQLAESENINVFIGTNHQPICVEIIALTFLLISAPAK
jgi:hypothetical protein